MVAKMSCCVIALAWKIREDQNLTLPISVESCLPLKLASRLLPSLSWARKEWATEWTSSREFRRTLEVYSGTWSKTCRSCNSYSLTLWKEWTKINLYLKNKYLKHNKNSKSTFSMHMMPKTKTIKPTPTSRCSMSESKERLRTPKTSLWWIHLTSKREVRSYRSYRKQWRMQI